MKRLSRKDIEKVRKSVPHIARTHHLSIPADYQVQSVIIVGGLLDSGNEGELSFCDKPKLAGYFSSMQFLGVRVSDDVTVDLCNIKYGDDFVRDAPRADSLIFAWVNKGVRGYLSGELDEESELLDMGHSWKAAMERSNSDFIVVNSDNYSCVGQEDVPEKYIYVGNTASNEHVISYDTYCYYRSDPSMS